MKKLLKKISGSNGKTPNVLTVKTIEEARAGKGITKPIKNIRSFINSL